MSFFLSVPVNDNKNWSRPLTQTARLKRNIFNKAIMIINFNKHEKKWQC